MNKERNCKMCPNQTIRNSGLCSACEYAKYSRKESRKNALLRRNFIRGEAGVLSDNNGNEWIVDVADFEKCKMFLWCEREKGEGYARNKTVGDLHRFILPNCSEVDHINRNRFDNRRANLRNGSNGINQRNRKDTEFPGVSKLPSKYILVRPWRARIFVEGGKEKHVGLFATQEEAHAAVLRAARPHGLENFYRRNKKNLAGRSS